ncbi:MAG: VOC family protein [Chitinophagaceae bacterium]
MVYYQDNAALVAALFCNKAIMKACTHLKLFFVLLSLLNLVCLHITAQEIKRPPITGISCVQFQVTDIKKSAVFYHSLMGYQLPPAVANSNGKNKLITIAVNQRQTIALQDGLPAGQDERLLGVSFQTTDAAAMLNYLQSKGIKVPLSVTKKSDAIYFSITDPDGHSVEFIQYNTTAHAQPQQPDAISKRILHAGLTIKSAQAANDFYAAILGFSEIWRGGANDSITSWINMRVPEGTDYIEYMLVTGPVNRQQLGSMHHIALMVPDMQMAVDKLLPLSNKTGYTVAAPRIGRNNRWQLNLFDPDGTRIELMEPFPMR